MYSNTSNTPSTNRVFQPKGKNYFNMSDGLQGLDLEFAKTILILGRSLDKLRSALHRFDLVDSTVGEEIKNRLKMDPRLAAQCIRVSRTYRPDGDKDGEFEFYYLIAIPIEVLDAFRPHIIQYFENPSQGIGQNMWVTKKSIEIYVALKPGQPKWHDLKFLSVAEVKDLPTLVASTGYPPQEQSSTQSGYRGVSHQDCRSTETFVDGYCNNWEDIPCDPYPSTMDDLTYDEIVRGSDHFEEDYSYSNDPDLHL